MNSPASRLAQENKAYRGSAGVSAGNRDQGFIPAFKDGNDNQVELSRFRDGRIAPCHLLEGLPDYWVTKRDSQDRIIEIKAHIISGFVRCGEFFTRNEAIELISAESETAA